MLSGSYRRTGAACSPNAEPPSSARSWASVLFCKKSTGDNCGFLQLWHLCLLCELRLCLKVSQLRVWVDRPHTCRTAGVRREVFCFSGFFSCGKIHVTEKSPSQPCFSVQARAIVCAHGVCRRHRRPPRNFVARNRSFGSCSRSLHPPESHVAVTLVPARSDNT